MNLSIKNAPDDLVRRLKLRAERNHRSLQGELMAIIEAAAYTDPRDAGTVSRRDSDEPAAAVRAEWPPVVQRWRGVPEMPPFEAYRGELDPPHDDAFS